VSQICCSSSLNIIGFDLQTSSLVQPHKRKSHGDQDFAEVMLVLNIPIHGQENSHNHDWKVNIYNVQWLFLLSKMLYCLDTCTI